jgi:hypothetical protein
MRYTGSMLLVIHIAVAVTGLLMVTFAAAMPSVVKLRTTYGLVAATFVSGAYLVWQLHAPLVSSCLSGVLYLAAALGLTGVAQRRLAKVSVRTDKRS